MAGTWEIPATLQAMLVTAGLTSPPTSWSLQCSDDGYSVNLKWSATQPVAGNVSYLQQGAPTIITRKTPSMLRRDQRRQEEYKARKQQESQNQRPSKDEEYLQQLIEQEQHNMGVRKQFLQEEEQREKTQKRKNKEALIDELMFSDLPASAILATHRDATKEDTTVPKQSLSQFSTGVQLGYSAQSVSVPTHQAEIYSYTPVELDMCGPDCPSQEDILSLGYILNIRGATDSEKGGGYEADLGCRRAVQDGLCGLFFFPDVPQPPSSQDQPSTSANAS